MRLATFNILHGRSLHDDEVDLDRYARAITDLDADVLALQEVDRGQPRSHGADLTAIAAEAMGAVEHRFAATLNGVPDNWAAGPAEGEPAAPAYGIALLSRLPVRQWMVVPLKGRAGRVPIKKADEEDLTFIVDEPRVALAAVIETPEGPLTVVNTHLTFLADWSRLQLRKVIENIATLPRPAVLMGDLNLTGSRPNGLTGWRTLATELTYPVGEPDRQIDHILAEGAIRAAAPARSVDTGLSDHRALVVEVARGWSPAGTELSAEGMVSGRN